MERNQWEQGAGGQFCNHTNTTGGYISSHHDWTLSVLEFVQDPITFILLFVSVDGYFKVSTRLGNGLNRLA